MDEEIKEALTWALGYMRIVSQQYPEVHRVVDGEPSTIATAYNVLQKHNRQIEIHNSMYGT